MKWIDDFFRDLDGACAGAPPLRLDVIGSVALMLQTDYARGTKDGDVLQTAALTAQVRARLLALAGPGTPMAKKHRLYLDIVQSGLPFLPHVRLWRPPTADYVANLHRVERDMFGAEESEIELPNWV